MLNSVRQSLTACHSFTDTQQCPTDTSQYTSCTHVLLQTTKHWQIVHPLCGILASVANWKFYVMSQQLFASRPSNMLVYLMGRICTDNFTCCHTEIEVEDQTFYLTQSQYTDTGTTSPSADPITPGAWQGSHCSANF